MVGKNGDTVESLRELISVPPEIETLLQAYAQFHPVEGREIEMSLRFRERVLEEFEQLTRHVILLRRILRTDKLTKLWEIF
jgi:hypothetical protein